MRKERDEPMSITTLLKNHFVYAVLVFISAFAALFLVILPLHERIRAEGDEIQKILAKTENSERKISRLPEFESQYAIIRESEDRIRLMLSEDRVVDFIREIEALAGKTGGEVTIAQGAAQAPAPAKAAASKEKDGADDSVPTKPKTIEESLPWEKSLRLKIRFSGAYAETVNFLHKVETLPYRLDVLSVDFRPAPEDERRFSVEGDLFSASPTETAAEPVPPPSELLVNASFEIAVYLE